MHTDNKQISSQKPQFNLIVTGGPDFNNKQLLTSWLDHLLVNKKETHNICIISGELEGAESYARSYANESNLDFKCFNLNGGFDKRNTKMIKVARREQCAALIFYNGKSRNLKDIMPKINHLQIKMKLVKYVPTPSF